MVLSSQDVFMSKLFFIWIAISIFLLAAEISTGALVFIFFSAASFIAAFSALSGVFEFPLQVIGFIALGTLGLLLFRKKLTLYLSHSRQLLEDN